MDTSAHSTILHLLGGQHSSQEMRLHTSDLPFTCTHRFLLNILIVTNTSQLVHSSRSAGKATNFDESLSSGCGC